MTNNKYCQALAQLRSKPEHALKEVGDQWRTPDLLFWGINSMFGPLMLDLFADNDNAKCPVWYTAEDNALAQNWSEMLESIGGAAFGNPPYSRSQYHEKQAITGMRNIMAHALAMRELGGRYVFLIKAATGEVWWPEEADHIALIRGRISFDLPVWYRPAVGQPAESSAGFGAAIAVFDKTWRGERWSYIHRDALEAKGRAAMSLALFSAGRNQPPATTVISEPLVSENRIWPLEVGLLFNHLAGGEDLEEDRQHKIKSHINQLWLEKTPNPEILAIANGLVKSMLGGVNV